jgi:hypothetical protein
VLIGLELPSAVRGLTSVELTLGLVVAGVVAVVVIGVRFGWLFTSPYVIRVLGAHPPDTSVDQERRLAETAATEEALDALPGLADGQGTDADVIDRLRREVEEHLEVLRADGEGNGDEPAIRHDQQYSRLRLAVLQHKRDTVLRLRDERRIDDTVLRLV